MGSLPGSREAINESNNKMNKASLKNTPENHAVVGICYSAIDWAKHAIAAEKIAGPEGFENFCSGPWKHWPHYKHISKLTPETSRGVNAIEEMQRHIEYLTADIERHALELDDMIRRLQRMNEQISEVI